MKLINSCKESLMDYTTRQISHFFPDNRNDPVASFISDNISEALARTHICINSVRCWESDKFNYLHSSQYCTYLYFLSNTIWKNTGNQEIATKLFLLNKLLNGIDCFYEIEMPEKFFIGHSVGIVLAKAVYADYLVLYQNSTIGKNHGVGPSLGEGVVLYPNSAIIGRCQVGDQTIVSQGTSIINKDCAGNSLVFNSTDGALCTKPIKQNPLPDIFRDF